MMFVRLYKSEPVSLFDATWSAARTSLQRAYESAFEAASRRNAHMDLWNASKEGRTAAYAEDIAGNHQASIVLLAADDALQRLAAGVGVEALSLRLHAGPVYRHGVHFTSLIRACTNAVRHVSEWDDHVDRDDGDSRKLYFPYSDPRNVGQRALQSITVLQEALGVGIHDRLYMAPCLDALMVIDGQWYDQKVPADFSQFEGAVLAARDKIVTLPSTSSATKTAQSKSAASA